MSLRSPLSERVKSQSKDIYEMHNLQSAYMQKESIALNKEDAQIADKYFFKVTQYIRNQGNAKFNSHGDTSLK